MGSVEFTLEKAIPDYALATIESQDRGQIQPVVSSPIFNALVEAVQAAFCDELANTNFEVLRASGIVCHDVNAYRPGILLWVQERGREGTIGEKGRERVTAAAERVRERIGMA